ncbi:methyl-accepting chemotaxis sensory transducer with Cache sensor [Aeromonas sp. RU39B]|uniref:methyl-accepting chemotaxis protein n=1 Tax=Aeromonas sp. RU39B TaxID=1907416 RepID=UPI0009548D15|nr:methyl-accepting chemotaxis protein [Aeromonas sp. RU39B]SIP89497.1 methyl-accepting chemotaxis sensory transducer with Cache sensor [Aeromonas sp. RU39B]
MKSLSVQWRITLFTGLCLLLLAASLSGLALYQGSVMQDKVNQSNSQSARANAEQLMQALGQAQAVKVSSYLDESFYRAKLLAQDILFQRKNAEENFLSSEALRTSVNQLLRESLAAAPNLVGVYAVFEPDQLDSGDAIFVNSTYLGANDKGRFSVYWTRKGNEIESQIINEANLADASTDANGMVRNQRYRCSMDKKSTCLLDPYLAERQGQTMLLTSVTVPMVSEGKVIGVVGVDLALAPMQQVVDQIDQALYQGAGDVLLVSQAGNVVGQSGFQVEPGQPVGAKLGEIGGEIAGWLTSGQSQTRWSGADWLQTFIPIPIAGASLKWGVFIQLPRSQVLADAEALDAQLRQQASDSSMQQLLIAVVITLLALGAVTLLARQVVAPIRDVVARLRDIASGEGDLTQRLRVARHDEIGALAHWFNLFLDKLQGTISDVAVTVQGARGTAEQAASGAVRTRDGMQSQLREVELVATAFEELSASAIEVVSHAGRAVAAADEAGSKAREGRQVVIDSQQAMAVLMQTIEEAKPMVERLSAESGNISTILGVIQSIAEQTNLLALNAAIEAARAGEQGRGFAVVADEVRNLAGRTQSSVVQIRELIDKLQGGTGAVVDAITQSHTQAGHTRQQVEASVETLERIGTAVETILQMNEQIAHAAEQQTDVIHSLNGNVTNIRDVSHSINQEASTSAEVGREMFTLADKQQALMGQFKV